MSSTRNGKVAEAYRSRWWEGEVRVTEDRQLGGLRLLVIGSRRLARWESRRDKGTQARYTRSTVAKREAEAT